jgi:hypothetical protein
MMQQCLFFRKTGVPLHSRILLLLQSARWYSIIHAIAAQEIMLRFLPAHRSSFCAFYETTGLFRHCELTACSGTVKRRKREKREDYYRRRTGWHKTAES